MTLHPSLKDRQAILVVILLLLLPVAKFSLFIASAPGSGKTEVIFNLKGGYTFRRIADELASRKVITSPLMFTLYARLRGEDGKVKAGFYRFSDGMTPVEILRKLVNGDVYLRPLALPEGYSIYQAAELIEQQGVLKKDRFLALCYDRDLLRNLGIAQQSVEGYLLPGTYNVEPGMDEAGLIRAMTEQFDKVRRAKYGDRVRDSGRSWHEILTLASMVDKEAVVPAERPVIASVFINRLGRKMRLQSDPTAVYGVRAFAGKVTKRDILHPSLYNTYLIEGLPLGPIGNPGDGAIEAVLAPAATNYLYFVARQDGSHHFSSTLGEHNRAVEKYLRSSRQESAVTEPMVLSPHRGKEK